MRFCKMELSFFQQKVREQDQHAENRSDCRCQRRTRNTHVQGIHEHIVQNDVGNRHSPTVICAAITSQMNKAKLPTHVELDCTKYALVKDSVVLLEQLRTIDKTRLKDKVCHLDNQILIKIDKALEISLELLT